jgi:ATP-dependent RNA helicase DeaD
MSRQTMLFSATIPPEIADLAQRFMFEPRTFRVAPQAVVATGIEEVLYRVHARDKARALAAVLREERPEKALVFTATREATSELARVVRDVGLDAMSLSSLLSQANRERAMKALRQGEIQVLVATDVAARGIDVIDISHVINYDLPTVPDDYIHRIGRTGRAERTGKAITLATPADDFMLREIESRLARPIPRGRLSGLEEPPPGKGVPRSRRGGREGRRSRRRPRGGGRSRRQA